MSFLMMGNAVFVLVSAQCSGCVVPEREQILSSSCQQQRAAQRSAVYDCARVVHVCAVQVRSNTQGVQPASGSTEPNDMQWSLTSSTPCCGAVGTAQVGSEWMQMWVFQKRQLGTLGTLNRTGTYRQGLDGWRTPNFLPTGFFLQHWPKSVACLAVNFRMCLCWYWCWRWCWYKHEGRAATGSFGFGQGSTTRCLFCFWFSISSSHTCGRRC